MTTAVARPAYVNTGGAGHTLDEIALQGGSDNGNTVELGWFVSTDVYGDADPHIFVYHWVNGAESCYDDCGWQQWSNTFYPRQNVASLIGREVYIGYVFWQGNWWAWFDDQWMGYFPGSLWGGAYSKTSLIQWFGEVASLDGVPPQTQMGDGIHSPARTAARMRTLCDVDAAAWVCWYRDQQSVATPTTLQYYGADRIGFGDMRYGEFGSLRGVAMPLRGCDRENPPEILR